MHLMKEVRFLHEIDDNALAEVGGKALGLARLARAGLPVPEGFCIGTTAQRRILSAIPSTDAELAAAVEAAYRQLGEGMVAVRSSATSEDGAITSFAGQQETILGVTGSAAVMDAVRRCWESLRSERALAYRRRQGIDDAELAMAVVVQRLISAEVSGVLFTRDPLDPEGKRMLVEASWGLGETIVSGRVSPDRYWLEFDTGEVLQQEISVKKHMTTPHGPSEVSTEKQAQPCLNQAQLKLLTELGRKVEALEGQPRDIEWAYADGRFWLLQARPITAITAKERETLRQEEIARLKERAAPEGTVWSRFNLSEILPEPTPMTWAMVSRFMSGRGGLGQMYRDLGFEPDPALDEIGIYDLVCGRPYCNLTRSPRMQFAFLPFEHSFEALKASPQKALYPQPTFNPTSAWRISA